MLSFNQLRAVVALHDHRHFNRAAESISITQPALTLSIKSAEKIVGQILFDRSQRDVQATDAGLLVVKHARDILARFSDLEAAVTEFNGVQLGEVAFGVAPFVVKKGLSDERAFVHPRPRASCDDARWADIELRAT